jgi:hypothetical protein
LSTRGGLHSPQSRFFHDCNTFGFRRLRWPYSVRRMSLAPVRAVESPLPGSGKAQASTSRSDNRNEAGSDRCQHSADLWRSTVSRPSRRSGLSMTPSKTLESAGIAVPPNNREMPHTSATCRPLAGSLADRSSRSLPHPVPNSKAGVVGPEGSHPSRADRTCNRGPMEVPPQGQSRRLLPESALSRGTRRIRSTQHGSDRFPTRRLPRQPAARGIAGWYPPPSSEGGEEVTGAAHPVNRSPQPVPGFRAKGS